MSNKIFNEKKNDFFSRPVLRYVIGKDIFKELDDVDFDFPDTSNFKNCSVGLRSR